MSLFSVMYLNGKLAAAMFLWQGATVQDCQEVNKKYYQTMATTPAVKTGKIKMSQIKLGCEWHKKNPVSKK